MPHDAPTCNDETTIWKVETTSRSAWEMVLNAEEHDDAKHDFQIVEEQEVETSLAPAGANDLIATVL